MKLFFVLAVLWVNASLVQAQYFNEVSKKVPSDRAQGDTFGKSVSISGNVAVVGANYKDHIVSETTTMLSVGAAYIFTKNENGVWSQTAKLQHNDLHSHDSFGNAVSISENTVVVGAYYNQYDANNENWVSRAGAAYVFEKDINGNWNQKQKLVASDRASGDAFGWSVAIEGEQIIIGAHTKSNTNSSYVGAAYIFEKDGADNWVEKQKLLAGDGAESNYFGWSADIKDSLAIVGAYLNSPDNISKAGAAYVFEKQLDGTWVENQKLTASDAESSNQFGYSTVLGNNQILIGAPLTDLNAVDDEGTINSAGAVYVFQKEAGDWRETQKLIASDRKSSDRYGSAISVSDNLAIVGAHGRRVYGGPENDELFFAVGIAYVLKYNGNKWEEIQSLEASDFDDRDYWGAAVGISESDVIVGAYREAEDENGQNSINSAGSVYFFEDDLLTDSKSIIKSNLVSVFPNPVKDKEIHFHNILGKIRIYNSNGEQVIETNNNESCDVSYLSNGLYLLKSDNYETKFIIKK